jgi:predicted AAA+ superfamily ATPase
MIKRYIKQTIVKSLELKEISIITGARQIGKTTILKEIISDLNKQQKKSLYFNLDIEEDRKYFNTQQDLLNKIKLEIGQEHAYIFIDEIQQKEDAGRFLKGIYDMGLPYKFIVTGSGSLELKEKISEALTGRKYLIEMKPVSFREFTDYKTHYRYSNRLAEFFEVEKSLGLHLLTEYMTYGGYPAVITADTSSRKQEIMNEVFRSYITKDLSFLLGLRHPDKFIKLIRLLAIQSGNIINYSRLSQDTGIRTETLKTYLWYAEQTFIIRIISPWFSNPKKELTKSPTIYFNDLGMLNFNRNNFNATAGDGMLFQNFIQLQLQNQFENALNKINYWRTKDKAEVDFILHPGEELIPVEVKYKALKKPEIERSFRSFINTYKPKRGIIYNLDYSSHIQINGTDVRFMRYWEEI